MALKSWNADDLAAKWKKNAQNAASYWKDGINNVTESPMEKAAKQVEKMRSNLLDAIDSGKWEKRVKAVDLDTWKDKTTSKGQSRYTEGVSSAESDMAEFMGEWMSYQEKIQKELEKMPTTTLQDNINRMVKQVEMAAEFSRS